jgi:hypothetical protein
VILALARLLLAPTVGKKGVANLPHLNSDDAGKALDAVGKAVSVGARRK